MASQFAFEAANDPTPIVDLSNREVRGMAIVPLHVYWAPGKSLHKQLCAVLAREAAGAYSGKLNFLGGKCSDKSGSPWQTLYEETFEELGLSLDYQLFKQSVISFKWMRKSMIFFVHIKGLSATKWTRMDTQRKAMGLPWKYTELHEIRHVPVAQIEWARDTSQYVQDALEYVKRAARSGQFGSGVHCTEFPRASGSVPGL